MLSDSLLFQQKFFEFFFSHDTLKFSALSLFARVKNIIKKPQKCITTAMTGGHAVQHKTDILITANGQKCRY